VLVLPTYHAEGFPMSIFQAVASGMGIVTTRIRAAADHLREPDNCLFVPARDPDGLAAVLDQLLSEPQLLRAMRAANRRLSRHFERHVVASEFADIYATLVE
jgi:glycosyltransferase involved in cell wall biosynthesis